MTVDLTDTRLLARLEATSRRFKVLRSQARRDPWDGRSSVPRREIMDSLTEPGRATSVSFTFDVGYHASGWWRNSEYDSCYHLSICHPTATTIEACSQLEVRMWARAAFPQHYHWSWTEPALDKGGADQSTERCGVPRLPHVAHIRLFTDQAGHPIKPVGEVYDLVPYEDGTSPAKIFR